MAKTLKLALWNDLNQYFLSPYLFIKWTMSYHVTLSGVDSVCQTLNGDPLDRHLRDAPLSVVVSIIDLLRQAKVSHTHIHVLI